jgi:nifR3 family TIM-barrel protein
MKDFWKKLKKPIMVQAPMSGVTDQAFRLMLVKYGSPDVFWTEFICASALFSPKAQKYCFDVLKFSKKERPIVAQIFGANLKELEKASQIVAGLGFDGIDINMGCPDRNVEKQGAGSALIKNPEQAVKVIRAVKKGAHSAGSGQADLPVSVKTRLGYSENEIKKWIPIILKENVSAITVHFRSAKQAYAPPARWELAKELIELRNKYAPETLLIGNGDVQSLKHALQLVKETGLDGIMIGRAVLGNPWFFSDKNPSLKQKLKAIIEHAGLLGPEKHWDTIKKHFHAYCKNFVGAKELREQLMKTKNASQAKEAVKNFIKDYKLRYNK